MACSSHGRFEQFLSKYPLRNNWTTSSPIKFKAGTRYDLYRLLSYFRILQCNMLLVILFTKIFSCKGSNCWALFLCRQLLQNTYTLLYSRSTPQLSSSHTFSQQIQLQCIYSRSNCTRQLKWLSTFFCMGISKQIYRSPLIISAAGFFGTFEVFCLFRGTSTNYFREAKFQ